MRKWSRTTVTTTVTSQGETRKKGWRRRPDLNRGWRFCSRVRAAVAALRNRSQQLLNQALTAVIATPASPHQNADVCINSDPDSDPSERADCLPPIVRLQTPEKVGHRYAQRVGEGLQRLNRDVRFTTLDLPNMCPVQAGTIGEDVLRPAPLFAERPDASAELLLNILHAQQSLVTLALAILVITSILVVRPAAPV